MVEHTIISEEPILQSPSLREESAEAVNHTLEARVARLEDVVASLQDTHHLEERVTERLSAQLSASSKRKKADKTPNIILEAGRQLLPAALQTVREQTDVADVASDRPLQHHPWLLFDALAEARAMFRMYFDNRYRVSWLARITPLLCGIMLVLSWFLVSGIWLVGPIVDKVFDLILAFVVYKVLHREVQSYRFAIADAGVMTSFRTVSNNTPAQSPS